MMKFRTLKIAICFNFEDEKFKEVESVAIKQGIKIKRPKKDEFAEPVGSMAGLLGVEGKSGIIDFDDEFMLLYGFPGTELDKFLKALRANKIDVPLKSMLTETNKSWLPGELIKEIKKEHEQMNK